MSTNSSRSFRWLLWTLAGLGFILDQAGKYGVFALLQERAWQNPDYKTEQVVIPGALRFHVQLTGENFPSETGPLRAWSGEHQPHVNHGAFLGFGSGNEYGGKSNLIFSLVSVAAAVAIIWWSSRRSIAGDWLLCVALGLILAGTLGNLYDRLVFDGVRDYLYWFFVIPTAIFNLADFLLICGALLLLGQAFWNKSAKTEEAPESYSADSLPQVVEAK